MKILLCAVPDGIGAAAMRVLAGGDQEFLTVPDVTAALDVMKRQRPAIVVVGGGTCAIVAEACRELRAAETCGDAVIVAAPSEQPDDVHALIGAGADDFFVEPLDEDVLRIRLLLAQRAAKGIASHRAEALWASTVDSIGDGIVATDVKGALTHLNPTAETLTGWSLAEARSKAFAEVLPLVNGDTGAEVEEPIERVLREGGVISLASRTVLKRRDGTSLPIADSCSPIRTSDGKITGAVLVLRDLSAQRDADAVAAKHHAQRVVADRMASVGTLAAGVAHEINNPLTYAAANVELAIEELRARRVASRSGRTEDLETMLCDALEGIARVTKIVSGLRTYSRIEDANLAPVDLAVVIELALQMSRNEIGPRALVTEYGSLPLVDANEARLGQVFINLLVNAGQAFEESDEAGEIRIATSTDLTGRAIVEIGDNGRGIPAPLLDRVFDPFFTTKPVGVGKGLGLTISHNIVTEMGGQLSVESVVGSGTTFRVALPPSSARRPSVPPASKRLPGPGPVRAVTVLVIDDEPAVGAAIRRILREHHVTVVTSARDALDLLAAGNTFELVICDLMMPGVSGMDLFKTLGSLYPEIAARVVFITGGAFTAEARAFLERVPNKRMEKPFSSTKLRELVTHLTTGG